jgi:N-methylhydantoinase A
VNSSALAHTYAVGVDIGGTFTDCAVLANDTGRLVCAKVPTTPHDPSIGFFETVEAAAAQLDLSCEDLLARTSRLVHGTTTGTNAIVSRRGVKVGLLTTSGHRDLMHLMKGAGRTKGLPPDVLLHLPVTSKPEPLVPKPLIAEVKERVDADGDVVAPLDEASAREGIRHLLDQGVKAIAVSFLWSIENPAHERRVADLIREADSSIYVTCGHEIASTVGEYPRTAAAVVNAYIGPLMVDYVTRIETGAKKRGYKGRVLFAQCAGGAITAQEARVAPIRTVQSGPVSGVVGSAFLAEAMGIDNVISADMGGTTFDVSMIRSRQPLTRDYSLLERFELALPTVDIESVGAGGGSIAWIDDSGRLQVGPVSAGAVPGPACYGRGGLEPTVTDADVVLGIIDAEGFLHGEMTIDGSLAKDAIGALADKLELSLFEAAAGINRIVDSRMADLIRRMSVLRGLDPREFTCFAFGGGGAVHAGAVAQEIGCRRIVVPLQNVAAVWSAVGAATADVVHVHQRPYVLDNSDTHNSNGAGMELTGVFEALEAEARSQLEAAGFGGGSMHSRRTVRMRYTAQVHSVEVPVKDGPIGPDDLAALAESFSEHYESLYGRGAGYTKGGLQITSAHVRATHLVERPHLGRETSSSPAPEPTTRPVYWGEVGDHVETPVLRLLPGSPLDRTAGPLLIELPDTVAVVHPGQEAWVDRIGNLVIDLVGR